MSKKIQLTIPKPCHENWDAMTQVEKGKFCGSCQKQVVDFSDMSDRQVAEFFKKPSSGSVCGRFMNDQLDRNIEIPRKRIPWVKYFFQIAIPAFLVSIKTSAQKTQGKIKVNTVTTDTTRRPVDDDLRTLGMIARPMDIKPFIDDTVAAPVKQPIKGDIKIATDTVPYTRVTMGIIAYPYEERKVENDLVKGKVVDENGEIIPFASIVVKGTRTGIMSNANGEFKMKLTANTGKVILIVSSVGYETTELPFDRANHPDLVILQLRRSQYHLVGELVVTRKPEIKKEIKNVPLIPAIIKDATAGAFKVFPNPTESGSNITIEWKQTEEGYFTLQLLNQSGQAAHQQEIWIDTEARQLDIDIPLVAAGSYFLVLTNKKSGKKYSEKIIIQ